MLMIGRLNIVKISIISVLPVVVRQGWLLKKTQRTQNNKVYKYKVYCRII